MQIGKKFQKISCQVCFICYIFSNLIEIDIHIAYIGQQAVDCPDLVAHVFYQKQQALLKIICDGYFGAVAVLVYTIEYQKRGLPHMHLLIFLENQDKIHIVQQVDALMYFRSNS